MKTFLCFSVELKAEHVPLMLRPPPKKKKLLGKTAQFARCHIAPKPGHWNRNSTSFIPQLKQLRFHRNVSIVSVKSNGYFLRKKTPTTKTCVVFHSCNCFSAVVIYQRVMHGYGQRDPTGLEGFYSNRAESW